MNVLPFQRILTFNLTIFHGEDCFGKINSIFRGDISECSLDSECYISRMWKVGLASHFFCSFCVLIMIL